MDDNLNRETWFEQELRRDVDFAAVDYSAVEERLFERISMAEKLGILSLIKIDEMPSFEKLDEIQHEVFSHISMYQEYEEPVNDFIRKDQQPNEVRWERLEFKLDERIRDISSLPLWEQILMASENEPSPGGWEQIEEAINNKIEKIEQQESWVLVAKKEEVQSPSAIENAESLLDAQLKSAIDKKPWEQVVRAEEIISYQDWEKSEEKLFRRIETSGKMDISKQPFWFIIEHYMHSLKTVGAISVAFIIMLAGIAGYVIQNRNISAIPTLVYELQGSNVGLQDLFVDVGSNYGSAQGGSVTLVNAHGVVELQNGSSVALKKVSRSEADYQVKFNNSDKGRIAGGTVSFLVNPHSRGQKFRVHTPDYEVIVTGTYFKVEPDLVGRVSTRVLEGTVKISSPMFEEIVLHAGQSLFYDLPSNQYRVHNGGPVMQRKEIERFPAVEELQGYSVVVIQASVAEAEVRINGRYFGTAPLAIRQPRGVHRVQVAKKGYVAVDTLININSEERDIYNVVLKEIRVPDVVETVDVPVKQFSSIKQPLLDTLTLSEEPVLSPELVAQTLFGVDSVERDETESIYLQAQKAEQNGNWRNAIKLFQQVFDNQNASRLRREDALFTIGKLRAEHEKTSVAAKEVFLTYLVLFPGGSFAGESWLRLAELEFRDNPENAIQYYLRYFEMFPRHPRISELQNRVGAIYLQQKKYDEAVVMFRQALTNQVSSRSQERRNIILNLHRALQEKGDQRSAEAVWEKYLAEAE